MNKKMKMKINFFTIIEKILNENYVVRLTKLTINDHFSLNFDQKRVILINNDNFSLEFQLLFKYLRSEVKLKVNNCYFLIINYTFYRHFFTIN